MRTIVIGCGTSIENGFGGPVRNTLGPTQGWYHHALHNHPNCITVDIDERCNPSVVLDFTTPDIIKVIRKLGYRSFDLIVLETLPDYVYMNDRNFYFLVKNCHHILSETGRIFIPRIKPSEVKILKYGFNRFAFTCNRLSNDFSLIYPIISAFTGKYADEFITMSMCDRMYYGYIIFKR